MKSQALRPAIWLTHFIMASLALSLFLLLSLYYYSGYSINSMIQFEFLDIGIRGKAEKWMIHSTIALLAIGHIISIFVFWKVREMLLTIRETGPFDQVVVKQIRLIMKSTILLILFHLIGSFFIDIVRGEFKVTLSTTTLITVFLAFLVYFLIEVFIYGSEMREEQKLTI